MNIPLARIASVVSLGLGLGGVQNAKVDVPYDNQPPRIVVDYVQGRPLYQLETVRFSVRVFDAEGDPVSLRLQTVPPGLVFEPVADEVSPGAREVRWRIPYQTTGVQHLVFEARDAAHPKLWRRKVVRVRVHGATVSQSAVDVGDVTGDGLPDVVGGASNADVGGAVDAGSLYVWAGAKSPSGAPTATLTAPVPAGGERLGFGTGDTSQLADVTGDGVLDVVVTSAYASPGGATQAGAIYVFEGGAALFGTRTPDAVLAAQASVPSSLLGATGTSVNPFFGPGDQSVLIVDVDGDRVDDVLAAAPFTTVGGVADAGAVYFWKGGALSGTVLPTAELFAATPGVGDYLAGAGGFEAGQLLHAVDVTGDGVLDVVAGAPFEDGAGAVDAGALHVWRGNLLSGAVPAQARLAVPGASTSDFLGRGGRFRRDLRFADVTGDGVADVVAAAPFADVPGTPDAGAVYVFRGGPGLLGAVSPAAALFGTGGTEGMGAAVFHGLRTQDVTGDGVADVVVPSPSRTFQGVIQSGAVYVFRGGPALVGSPPPHATLREPTPGQQARLGDVVEFADVTGDGLVDVVASVYAEQGVPAPPPEAFYVWRGGASLAGVPAPQATLVETIAGGFNGGSMLFDDVTGDGQADVISPGTHGTAVWAGGGALVGVAGPAALLRIPGQAALSLSKHGQAVFAAELTGDGVRDVVVASSHSGSSSTELGSIDVYAGGALLGTTAPTARLLVTGATPFDALGNVKGQGLQLADLDGDGQLDVVTGTAQVHVGGATGAGALYSWRCGPGLAGPVYESGLHVNPAPAMNDAVGYLVGHGFYLSDVDGDRSLEVLSGGYLVDGNGVQDSGALFLWQPLASLPPVTLVVPGAQASDLLGA